MEFWTPISVTTDGGMNHTGVHVHHVLRRAGLQQTVRSKEYNCADLCKRSLKLPKICETDIQPLKGYVQSKLTSTAYSSEPKWRGKVASNARLYIFHIWWLLRQHKKRILTSEVFGKWYQCRCDILFNDWWLQIPTELYFPALIILCSKALATDSTLPDLLLQFRLDLSSTFSWTGLYFWRERPQK